MASDTTRQFVAFVLAGEESLEDRLAEILLPDYRDSHFSSYAAFLGGSENAPAFFSELILVSS